MREERAISVSIFLAVNDQTSLCYNSLNDQTSLCYNSLNDQTSLCYNSLNDQTSLCYNSLAEDNAKTHRIHQDLNGEATLYHSAKLHAWSVMLLQVHSAALCMCVYYVCVCIMLVCVYVCVLCVCVLC